MPKPENIVPHQFKKGQSGNPRGRPKGERLQATVFKDILSTFIKTDHALKLISDKQIRDVLADHITGSKVTIDEAIYMVQALKAIKGDTQAAGLFMRYSIELPRQTIDMTSGGKAIVPPPWLCPIKTEEDNEVPNE